MRFHCGDLENAARFFHDYNGYNKRDGIVHPSILKFDVGSRVQRLKYQWNISCVLPRFDIARASPHLQYAIYIRIRIYVYAYVRGYLSMYVWIRTDVCALRQNFNRCHCRITEWSGKERENRVRIADESTRHSVCFIDRPRE